MISKYTQDLLEAHEWEFIPSHDIMRGKYGELVINVPEAWEHPNHGIRYALDEVLAVIANEIANENQNS